jgi:hypothetical protein
VFDFAALFDWKLLACRGWMLAGSGGAGFGCGAARCVAGVEQAGKHGNFDHTGEQQAARARRVNAQAAERDQSEFAPTAAILGQLKFLASDSRRLRLQPVGQCGAAKQ